MIKRLKHWLYSRFLPEYCRLKLLDELEEMKRKQDALSRENERLMAYIEGLETGIRAQKHIAIYNTAGKGG